MGDQRLTEIEVRLKAYKDVRHPADGRWRSEDPTHAPRIKIADVMVNEDMPYLLARVRSLEAGLRELADDVDALQIGFKFIPPASLFKARAALADKLRSDYSAER